MSGLILSWIESVALVIVASAETLKISTNKTKGNSLPVESVGLNNINSKEKLQFQTI